MNSLFSSFSNVFGYYSTIVPVPAIPVPIVPTTNVIPAIPIVPIISPLVESTTNADDDSSDDAVKQAAVRKSSAQNNELDDFYEDFVEIPHVSSSPPIVRFIPTTVPMPVSQNSIIIVSDDYYNVPVVEFDPEIIDNDHIPEIPSPNESEKLPLTNNILYKPISAAPTNVSRPVMFTVAHYSGCINISHENYVNDVKIVSDADLAINDADIPEVGLSGNIIGPDGMEEIPDPNYSNLLCPINKKQ